MKLILSLLVLSFFVFAAPAFADGLEAEVTAAKAELDKATAEAEAVTKTYQENAQKAALEMQALGAKYANPSSLSAEEAADLAKKQTELATKSAADAAAFAQQQIMNTARIQELTLKYTQLSEKWEAEKAAAEGK